MILHEPVCDVCYRRHGEAILRTREIVVLVEKANRSRLTDPIWERVAFCWPHMREVEYETIGEAPMLASFAELQERLQKHLEKLPAKEQKAWWVKWKG